MAANPSRHAQLWRLGIPLVLAWSLAWVLGLSVLAKVAIELRAELRDTDLDTQLALYATSIYGLTWFDEAGNFHDEILRLEPELSSAPYDIWVITPATADTPATVHLRPMPARFALANFDRLGTEVMVNAHKIYRNGQDSKGRRYRLYAIPTYLDQDTALTPEAMIVVVGDTQPG